MAELDTNTAKQNADTGSKDDKGAVILDCFDNPKNTGFGGGGLQDAFKRFKQERLQEHRLAKFMQKERAKGRKSPEQMNALRAKFVAQCKKYIGVPYAQRYHAEGDPDYDAPLFLDCCGLIRRALDDLQEDFGFRSGRWNQAYQYDTLPVELKFEEMKPGDLVFYTGTFYSDKAKQQKYDMVHVEIYLGLEGGGRTKDSTLGARLQKGHCKIFDSYNFTSKNYYDIKTHFRSIDTWLEGECRPHINPEWWPADPVVDPGKRSIFGGEEAADGETDAKGETILSAAEQQEEQPPQFYVNKSNGWHLVVQALTKMGWVQMPFNRHFSQEYDLKWVEQRSSIDYTGHKWERGQLVNHIPNNHVITSKLGLLETLRDYCSSADAGVVSAVPGLPVLPAYFPESYRMDRPAEVLALLGRHAELAKGAGDAPMWIFKPVAGNCGRGIRLLSTVQELEELAFKPSADVEAVDTINSTDRDSKEGQEQHVQPLQPAAGYVVKSTNERLSRVRSGPDATGVVQMYLTRPLLVTGRKFDMRVYCLVARTSPWVLYFHHGYLRLSLDEYSLESATDPENRYVHLTNASVQKKHPEYEAKRKAMIEAAQSDKVQTQATPPDTPPVAAPGVGDKLDAKDRDGNIWSMEAFAQYMEAHAPSSAGNAVAAACGGGGAFVREELPRQIKEVMVEVHKASKVKLAKRRGYFDLLGFDFMLDEQLQLHLLEVNTNPALHIDGAVHQAMLPALVQHSLEAVLHAQPMDAKITKAKAVAPAGAEVDEDAVVAPPTALKSIGGFELIVDEAESYEWTRNEEGVATDGECSPRVKLEQAKQLDSQLTSVVSGESN
jgi:hypothetical protein